MKYQCQRCGACCRWPGQVKVTEAEIRSIAHFLNMPEDDFIQRHTRLRFDRKGLALLEKAGEQCEFLVENSCLIQDVKPQQCRDFPNVWRDGAEGVCRATPVDA